MATITIYVPDQEPLELTLDGYEQVSIGRGPDNDVVLDHVSISGSHAVIQNFDGTFQVTDLGSTNGTFVNGEQIGEALLGHGTRIMFGSVESVFQDEATAGAESYDPGAGGSFGGGGHHAEIAEVSNRPSGYTNLSPIKKVVKKDALGQIAMIIGVVAVLAAIAVAAMAYMMTGA